MNKIIIELVRKMYPDAPAVRRDLLRLYRMGTEETEDKRQRFPYGTCYCGRSIVLQHGILGKPMCWACKRIPINCNCDKLR